ncbi:MAG TPA: glycosyltransferase, partial [Limnochordia bacterium]|nr:glycosyltransferase [Limnochordia bacterium]
LEIRIMSFQSDNPLHTNYTTLLDQARLIIKEHNIQLIHAHQIAGLKIAAQISQEFLVPVVFTAHGMFYPPRQLQSLIDAAEHVIAVSLPVASYINTKIGYSRQKISVIPNGIDVAHFAPAESGAFRGELGLTDREFLITLCSRIAWGKTRIIEDAMHAVEELAEESHVRLAIVGSGPDSGFVHALAKMVNRRHKEDLILVTGALLDPVDAYRSSDLVIGTARVALEAMSCGKPVIAAGNAGYVGLITPENFAEAWSVYFGDHDFLENSSASRFQADIKNIIGGVHLDAAKIRRLVAKHFSIQHVTGDLEQVYYHIMGFSSEPGKVSAPLLLPPAVPAERKALEPRASAIIREEQAFPLESPLVSVVIPTHNREQYLKECLDSLQKQTYRPLEILVIDDYSTDQTEKTVAEWTRQVGKKDDFRVVYYRLPRNLGFAQAQSIGYILAQGEYIANQDSDDISHPERIRSQVQFLQLDKEYSMVGTDYEVFSTDFNQRKKAHLVRYDNNVVKCYREGRHCVCFGSLLFKRAVVEKIGGLTTFMEGAEDYEFVARSIVQGFNVQNLREVLYYYRQHENQRSRDFYGMRQALGLESLEEQS